MGGPAPSGAAAAWSRRAPGSECGDGCQAGEEGGEVDEEEGVQEVVEDVEVVEAEGVEGDAPNEEASPG